MNKTSFDLAGYLKKNRALVEASLLKILGQLDGDRELIQAMTHSLMAGGKRLRPLLGLATAQACGGDPLKALPACCAIELIHTYSLIHDDLPAMDDDDLRRGVPTCHKQFSEATAILAGDALLTHAFYVLTQPQNLFDCYPKKEVLLELVAKISQASGVNGMVEGQMLDMHPPLWNKTGNKEAALAHLKKLHDLKTGRMIGVSVEAGALSVGADLQKLKCLKTYADHIGLAFQVMDDILNVEGDPGIMGKAAGSDLVNEKLTFPALIGLEQSKVYARLLIDAAIVAIDPFDGNAHPLRAIALYIIDRDR